MAFERGKGLVVPRACYSERSFQIARNTAGSREKWKLHMKLLFRHKLGF